MTPPTNSDDVICALAAHVRELTERLRATEAKLERATIDNREQSSELYDIRVALFDALNPGTPGSPLMPPLETLVDDAVKRIGGTDGASTALERLLRVVRVCGSDHVVVSKDGESWEVTAGSYAKDTTQRARSVSLSMAASSLADKCVKAGAL